MAFSAWLLLVASSAAPPAAFELVQPETFGAPGGQPNAWGDFDGDGDPDLFVGFSTGSNRLYRNDDGRFVDVAAGAGVTDESENTRAAAWGDFDGDGDLDLYVGFQRSETPNRIYRNDGRGRFTDAAPELGVTLRGTSRQAAWIDYDRDGDLDLFAAFRDGPNRLLRNDGARFTEVTESAGIGDPRKTVGAVWWDFDEDGDLDVFVANQEGDANGLFRNDEGRFVDVASELGVAAAGRPVDEGGVGPSVADYDGDGDLDLFVANYGENALYRLEDGRFTEAEARLGGPPGSHAVSSGWGDFDNDGKPDLYVTATINGVPNYPDHLFRNDGGGAFSEVRSEILEAHDATHGVQWIDFDADGDVDLSLTGNGPTDGHYLLRNELPAAAARRSLAIDVVDSEGRRALAGAEIRLYRSGTRELLGTRLLDTGSGYCSQSAVAVHFGLPDERDVDVEVTYLTGDGRRTALATEVRPSDYARRTLVIRTPRR